MMARGLLVVATGCTVAGIALVWTIQRSERTAAPPESLAPPPPVAGAQAQALSSLWVLAIGVSRYQDSNFNLQFAAADAQSIEAALQRQAGGRLHSQVKTLVLTDDDVTRESILDNMERFLGQAGPHERAVPAAAFEKGAVARDVCRCRCSQHVPSTGLYDGAIGRSPDSPDAWLHPSCKQTRDPRNGSNRLMC